jgi:hypothetical protein
MVRVLMMGSREASSAMLAKVEDVVLGVKRQGYALLVGDAPGVDAHVRVCAEALSVPTTVYGWSCCRRITRCVIGSWRRRAICAWRCGTGGRRVPGRPSSTPVGWASASSCGPLARRVGDEEQGPAGMSAPLLHARADPARVGRGRQGPRGIGP